MLREIALVWIAASVNVVTLWAVVVTAIKELGR
jgi:hypothetical protein